MTWKKENMAEKLDGLGRLALALGFAAAVAGVPMACGAAADAVGEYAGDYKNSDTCWEKKQRKQACSDAEYASEDVKSGNTRRFFGGAALLGIASLLVSGALQERQPQIRRLRLKPSRR
jgi:hypothetical protein